MTDYLYKMNLFKIQMPAIKSPPSSLVSGGFDIHFKYGWKMGNNCCGLHTFGECAKPQNKDDLHVEQD